MGQQLEVGQGGEVREHATGYSTAVEPFPSSLCHQCVHHHRVEAARSAFLMCRKLPIKYPPQPVQACAAFEPAPPQRS